MKKVLVICCLLAIASNVFAESVYSYDLTKDLIIGSVSLGLGVSSIFITRSDNMASRNQVLHKDNVNAFDRLFMYEYNKPIDIASDIVLNSFMVLPVVSLAGNFKNSKAWISYGIMYSESLLLVFGTCEAMKNSILRYRPFNYSGDIPPGKEGDYFKSFPSRHTAFAFVSAGFMTSTFFTEHPDSPWKIPLAVAAYTWAAGVGASRIISANHFMSDVLVGAAIGSLYGYLIPILHVRKKQENVVFTAVPNGFWVSCKL